MPAGAPVKYKPEYLKQIEKLCLLGATDVIIADFLNVTPQTVSNWQKTNPELFEAIKRAKIQADANVADSLYNRAKGYEWDEQQAHKLKEVTYNNGKRIKEVERLETISVHKVVPPDTTAAIYWLKVRQKGAWREDYKPVLPDGDLANITSVTFYPKSLPRGYYEQPNNSTDNPSA